VSKLQAAKQLRDAALRTERETFRRQQSDMVAALYTSETGTAVLTDHELEARIAGGRKK
jgi:hypothetical protein